MQADLVIYLIFFSKFFSAAPSAFLYPSPQWRRRVLIHQDTLSCLDENKVPSWPDFRGAFQAGCALALGSGSSLRLQKRNPVNSIGVLAIWIDCRTFLVNVIPEVSHVSISEKKEKKKAPQILFFSAFSVTITAAFVDAFPFFPPSLSFCVFADCVDKWESGLNVIVSPWLAGTLPTVFLRDSVTILSRMLGDLSLLFWRERTRSGGGIEEGVEGLLADRTVCRHCIFMSVLLSCAPPVGRLIFNFHCHY